MPKPGPDKTPGRAKPCKFMLWSRHNHGLADDAELSIILTLYAKGSSSRSSFYRMWVILVLPMSQETASWARACSSASWAAPALSGLPISLFLRRQAARQRVFLPKMLGVKPNLGFRLQRYPDTRQWLIQPQLLLADMGDAGAADVAGGG